MKLALALVVSALLVGCATTNADDYVKVYDRKYNEYRLVKKENPGAFVGTSATKQPARAPGQHP